MPTTVPALDNLIRDAAAAGATDTTLAPLLRIQDNAAALINTYDKWEHPGHLIALIAGDSKPTATQINSAATKDAAATTARAEMTGALEKMPALVFNQAHRIFDGGLADDILAEVNTAYRESDDYLQAIEDKWGTRTPDGRDILAQATGADLETIRGAAAHHRRLAAIEHLLATHYASHPTPHAPAFRAVDTGTHWRSLNLGNRFPELRTKSATSWFLTDDNEIGSVQHVRAKLNDYSAKAEQTLYGDARNYSIPKPRFIPKWTLNPDVDPKTIRFNPDGTPVDPAHLDTHEAYCARHNLRDTDRDPGTIAMV